MGKQIRVMDAMLSSPPTEQTIDIAKAIAALDRKAPSGGGRSPAPSPRQLQRVNSVRRALATTALGGLLIGGITLLTSSTNAPSGLAAGVADQANAIFGKARSGDCVNWPTNAPQLAQLVDCNDKHVFEVAETVAMQSFQQPCQQAVQRYLGAHYDPNSKFTASVMWPGETSQPVGRQLLCGLQLTGAGNQPVAFAGRIAELDQSKTWPAGTCLGIDPATSQSTDVPVDCAESHAQEITGSVNLANTFGSAPPAPDEQDAVLKVGCARTAATYLAPAGMRDIGVTPIYRTVSPQSWSAGSRQVSCGIGAPVADGGLAPLVGSAKGRLSINGEAPISAGVAAPSPVSAMLVAAESPQPPARQQAPTVTSAAPSAPAPVANPVAAKPPSSPAAVPAPAPSAPPGPLPGPAAPPSETPSAPVGQIIEIPGLAPITLPVFPPPAPPQPEG
jgi:hypothetical protein